MSGETDPLISLARVAELLGDVSKRTVQRMIAAGELPRVVVVSRRRSALPLSEVVAYIERRKVEGRR